MQAATHANRLERLIRPDAVHGSLYSDPAIFAEELEKIWYRVWIYVGHESEIPNAGDFVMKSIGPQPIIMTRDGNGELHLLQNRCPHRGNQVCVQQRGNARGFACPFHNWTFAIDGRVTAIAFADGYHGQDMSGHRLAPVPRVASYRGFVFGSFAAEGPTL